MKTLLLCVFMMVLVVTKQYGQDINIHKTDGSIITIPLSIIDSITFVETGAGFVCGTSTVTDADGNIYNTLQIGEQCWMKENLKTGTLIDGNSDQTDNDTIEKYCYENQAMNCDIYGGLYQWDEMMDYDTTEGIQGICPIDWHLPTDSEWTKLTDGLGGEIVAGGEMKETGTWPEAHWWPPNAGATNTSGFTALPGGGRYPFVEIWNGIYNGAYLWSSTLFPNGSGDGAFYRALFYFDPGVTRIAFQRNVGYSVRCLKD